MYISENFTFFKFWMFLLYYIFFQSLVQVYFHF